MSTITDPHGHVLPGQGHHGHVHVGEGHHHSSPVFIPYPVHHSSCYYHSDWNGEFGVLAGGVTLLILSIALTALGILAFAYGDIPWGITATVTGGLGVCVGLAMMIYDLSVSHWE